MEDVLYEFCDNKIIFYNIDVEKENYQTASVLVTCVSYACSKESTEILIEILLLL